MKFDDDVWSSRSHESPLVIEGSGVVFLLESHSKVKEESDPSVGRRG